MDPEAPGLYEYLGDGGRWGIDLLTSQGDMAAAPGVHKFTINCNWKFPSDNTPDHYHGVFTHASARMAGYSGPGPQGGRRSGMVPTYYPEAGVTVLSDYGHGTAARFLPQNWQTSFKGDPMNEWHLDETKKAKMDELGRGIANAHLNVFPNLFVPAQSRNVAIRMPKGPTRSEIWMWTFYDRDMPTDVARKVRLRSAHHFGPSGLMEQDDGENWDQSTAAMRGVVSARYPLNYQMALGHGEFVKDERGPAHINTHCNEHAQLWTYRAWSEFMGAASWADLKVNHSKPEGRV
jgi:hypothetical protein